MPKERKYTRSELTTLRRADLQNLYKIHGLKGANARTDTLLETLVSHFSSSAFPTRPIVKTTTATVGDERRRNGPAAVGGVGGRGVGAGVGHGGETRAKANERLKQGRTVSGRGPKRGVIKAVKGKESMSVAPVVELGRPVADRPTAGPSHSPTPPFMPLPAVPMIRSDQETTARTADIADIAVAGQGVIGRGSGGSSDWISEPRVEKMLVERDRVWEARMTSLERDMEKKVKELELRLEARLREWTLTTESTGTIGATGALQSRHQQLRQASAGLGSHGVPQVTFTSDTPTLTMLGKRVEHSPASESSRSIQPPPTKRVRMQVDDTEGEAEGDGDGDGDSDVPSPNMPPPPNTFADPHTPSPGHQGVRPDNSQTPAIGPDYFAHTTYPSTSQGGIATGEAVNTLPYPLFATTPRPAEPSSPTTDAPPSARRNRSSNAPRGSSLTPSRKRTSPAPRAVSDAHKELLSTISESPEPRSAVARRKASTETPTTLLGPALRGGSAPISPPQLSPSPSIGASEREGGFTYTPFPPVPRSHHRTRTPTNDLPGAGAGKSRSWSKFRHGTITPPRHRKGNSSSPAKDYMDVAMYGVLDPTTATGQSPSNSTTPGHRTMLGTERYRDTRFGDVPVVSWGTPNVDLGPGTPGHSTRKDW